ncbi:zinc-dependent metalloprotease [Seonamhaeicola sp.]|uniref:zinc-dependent metalloprotease n=1 Tax=Seonamhaeicola sp. TaxID=1912245 RepID=UPI00261064C3|nr:zinc-dependent metalloprotease [Seonamhaeicola sp.]
MKNIIFLFLTFLSIHVYAQRSCGTDEYMKQKLQDPEFKAKYEARQALFKQEFKKNAHSANSKKVTIKIPVAIHFPNGNPSDRTCLEALSRRQMDVLNADFRSTNTDISKWSAARTHYPGINAGSMDIQFELATSNHPPGMGLTDGNPSVTVGYNFGNGSDTDANWAGYVNIVVKDIDGLGVAPLGGSPANGDATEIDHKAFGTDSGCGAIAPQAPYHLGRTVTHEIGHFLNLFHTWGDAGSCTEDDNVNDTPNIDNPTYGCATPGSVVMCNNKSLTMNYMDYPDDTCAYMFTAGQAARSLAYLNTIISEFKSGVLSNNHFESENSFAILSNPVENELRLRTANNILAKDATLQIFDLRGASVLKTALDGNLYEQNINVSTLHGGLYIIRVTSGSHKLHRKIIIR